MKVCAYTHVRRTPNPTGVGQHILHMVNGLSRVTDLRMLVPRADADASGRILCDTALAALPATRLPLSRRFMELAWRYANHPVMDRWTDNADWLYCPAEAYVSVRRPRLAVTIHDAGFFEPDLPWSDNPGFQKQGRRWTKLFQRMRDEADLVLTVSEFTKSRLVELLQFDPWCIAVIGNGVEEIYFQVPAGEPKILRVRGTDPYAIVIGGLTGRKNGAVILAVADELARIAPKFRILVAGRDDPHLAEQAKSRPNIERFWYIPHEKLVPMLRRAVVLLFPSRYEGFGIPALEAMAAGTPAMVSHFASLPEVVAGAGIVIDVDRPDQIAAKLIELYEDEPQRTRIAEAALARGDRFHWDMCVQKLYDALCAHGTGNKL